MTEISAVPAYNPYFEGAAWMAAFAALLRWARP